MNKIKICCFFLTLSILLSSCNGKLPGADARKVSYDPRRVKKNLEEGKGFRLSESFYCGGTNNFVF